MKSKKLTYGLLVFVALLWGAIIYKLYKSYYPDEIEAEMASIETMDIQDIAIKRKVYKLEGRYTDPFLKDGGYNYYDNESVENTTSNNEKVLPSPAISNVYKPPVNWPEIQYLGRISNKSGTAEKGIISIDKNEFLIREGDEIKEVSILTMSKDSIEIKYQEEERTFYLKQS